jgi:hypothetical protein
MEAEVEAMRKQLEELQTATPDETDTISDLKKDLDEKERALYTLQVGWGEFVYVFLGYQGVGACRKELDEKERALYTLQVGLGDFVYVFSGLPGGRCLQERS